MRGWGAPVAAGAFWAGLLAWDVRPDATASWPWWWWLLAALATLAAAATLAPGRRRDDPVAASGLAVSPHPAVAAVAAPAVSRRRGAGFALASLAIGVFLAGIAWGGLSAARVEGSLLARLAPRTVTVTGTLREDPEAGAYGWHALVDVGRVSWFGGAAAIRETAWVGGNDETPEAVRGDQVSVRGTLQIPDDPGFADALSHRGVAVSVRGFETRRLGPATAPFIRLTQIVRAFVGRTIERIFPPREAGLLLGLVLGDA